jgi:hypothetical protein
LTDLVTLVVVACSAFFVALSFGLLIRYRQVSQKINASNDLGRDLWSALESRMKKQDERILDMMGRLEVIQSRAFERTPVERPYVGLPPPSARPSASEGTREESAASSNPVVTLEAASHITSNVTLDETEKSVLRLLGERPRSSIEVKELTGKSREHAARLMKGLFDAGLVARDSSKKPFVYQITENGRRLLSAG